MEDLNHHSHSKTALKRALLVTLLFVGVEWVGGYFANSLALMSDAAHLLTDVASLLLALFAAWISERPSSPTMSFGYHRAEILGALFSVLLIWLLAGGLFYEAIRRFSSPPAVQGQWVLGISVLGVFANLLSLKALHGAHHHSLNVKAAYLHVVSDMIGSIGAVIAGVVLVFTGFTLIDPMISILVAVLMGVSSWSLLKESTAILMLSSPEHLDPVKILSDLKSLPGVSAAHDLHIWSVGSQGRVALSVHLIGSPSEKILSEAHKLLEKDYAIVHTTIQVEHPDRFDSNRCYDCAKPSHAHP